MNRKLKRMMKPKPSEIRKAYEREAIATSKEVAAETEEYTKHHITGQLLTALALVMRKIYGWTDAETIKMLDEVNGITNALNDGEIDDKDLIAECEEYGIKVSWRRMNARTYIDALDIYEHVGSNGGV